MPRPSRKVKDFRKVQGQPAANREARALVEVRDPTDPGPAAVAAAVMADREPVAVTAEVPGGQVQAAEVPGGQVQAAEVPADQVQAAEAPVVPDPVAEVVAAIHRNWNAGFAVLFLSLRCRIANQLNYSFGMSDM
jgi:hypothetical protein